MHTLLTLVLVLAICTVLAACSTADASTGGRSESHQVQVTSFGDAPDGKPAKLYTLTNRKGMVAKISDYGATLVELHVPDSKGNKTDVVLGFDDAAGYAADNNPYFGATVGRVANRIAKGKFELDGKQYTLATNNEPNHLHGGKVGFSDRLWTAEPLATKEGQAVKFTYTSPDGEEEYPGKLHATTIYTLTDKNELKIEMSAQTDAPTIVNLCNHTYWNLAGHRSGNVLAHRLKLNASGYTKTDDTLIPTGEIVTVEDTPVDFTDEKPIGKDIAAFKTDKQSKITGGGYDLNYVVDREPESLRKVQDVLRIKDADLSKVAELTDPKSGREMTLYSNQPGVQLYTGNWIKDLKGKGSAVYQQHAGVCLETQKFPDSINHSEFPSVVLRPGETYRHVMVHKFDW